MYICINVCICKGEYFIVNLIKKFKYWWIDNKIKDSCKNNLFFLMGDYVL